MRLQGFSPCIGFRKLGWLVYQWAIVSRGRLGNFGTINVHNTVIVTKISKKIGRPARFFGAFVLLIEANSELLN
jgi:hypothetical protein